MCGICGFISTRPHLSEEEAGSRVQPMIDALHHRGPDEAGHRVSAGAVLGATRLAIRAISSGTQPLVDPATGVMVVCNGEIDNHRDLRAWLAARGRHVEQETDVAILPGLYLECGEDFVSRLAGVFALAVWDPRSRLLILARDRAGERALFFAEHNGAIRFASEIAALVADSSLPLDPDQTAIRHYLQFGSFVAPATPLRGLHRVAPAEIVCLSPEGTRRRRYWRWTPAHAGQPAPSARDFDPVFREAVRRQSDVDVDYGVFLSGGLDSSLVLAVAQSVRRRPGLRAYTLRFGEASFDEGDYAARMVAREGATGIPVWVRPEDFPTGIASLIDLVGEPLADPAWVPTALLARRAAQDVKMVLVGEGADELFGGYPTYLGAALGARYAALPSPLRAAIRRLVRAWPVSDRKVAISYLLKRFVDAEGMDSLQRHLAWTSVIPPATLARLGVAPAPAFDAPADAAELLDRVQRHDLETSLAEGLLTKADRASMVSSLELRAPFLDMSVMEFASRLPPAQRAHGLRTKIFLKEFATRYLPRDLIYRRKRGLSVPLGSWLRGPLLEWARARLDSDVLAGAGVDPKAVSALLTDHLARRADHARTLWSLLVLSEWFTWLAGRERERSKPAAGAQAG